MTLTPQKILLDSLRKERRLRYEELAAMMGCTRQVIQNAEKGVRKTQAHNVCAMVEAFSSVAPIDPTQRDRFMEIFGLSAALFDEAARKGEAKRIARLGRAPTIDAAGARKALVEC